MTSFQIFSNFIPWNKFTEPYCSLFRLDVLMVLNANLRFTMADKIQTFFLIFQTCVRAATTTVATKTAKRAPARLTSIIFISLVRQPKNWKGIGLFKCCQICPRQNMNANEGAQTSTVIPNIWLLHSTSYCCYIMISSGCYPPSIANI